MEDLWLLKSINEIVRELSDRIINRISLMGGATLSVQQTHALQNQIIAPTVSGFINVALMQYVLEQVRKGQLGEFDISSILDTETLINDMTTQIINQLSAQNIQSSTIS